MAEYYDIGFNIQTLLNMWSAPDLEELSKQERDIKVDGNIKGDNSHDGSHKIPKNVPLEVRKSIVITGLDSESIQYVKNTISSLIKDPLPLESFHIRSQEDIRDGALFVPKVILVAKHCPGVLLIDEEGDNGQLDFIYDELVEIGADVLIIYMGLPRAIYPPMRHMVYHPRMIDIVFPSQPILRDFAEENCLITTLSNTDFTNMQKNVMREWIMKPVKSSHPVFEHVAYLSKLNHDDMTNFWSEGEVYDRNRNTGVSSAYDNDKSYVSATEEHDRTSKRKVKKKNKLFKIKQKLSDKYRREQEYKRFIADNEEMMDENLEMEMYRQSGYSPADSLSQLSV